MVCFPEKLDPQLVAKLRAVSDRVEVTSAPYMEPTGVRTARTRGDEVQYPTPGELDRALRDELARAHVVVALDLPSGMAELAPKLRWVQGIGAGVGHLRTCGLADGVLVTTGAGIGAPSIADFVMGRLLAVWKRFDHLAELQRAHRWDQMDARGRALSGTTVGIVGFGAIGTAVAQRAVAFDLRVLAVRRHPAPHPLAERVVGPEGLSEVLSESDAVVVCAPATDETTSLFDADAFAAMRPGALFCNVARGTLVDEAALIAALESGQVGAAILDVAAAEPLPANSPLWDVPNVYLSPHSSAVIDRYDVPLFDLVEDNLRRWLQGGPMRNVFDLEAGY